MIVMVVTLLAYGCPLQAIVHAFGLDERTVAAWRDCAGEHCEQLHQAIIEQEKLDLVHVQAGEIRVKARGTIGWMGLAMMVSTRLWLAGVVSQRRDSTLADHLVHQVRRCAQKLCALLICTDGWSAYPNSIRRAFREKVKRTAGRGRSCLEVWSGLHIGTVIKRTVKKHLKEVIRQTTHGSSEQALQLLGRSKGGTMLNTSFIERLNGTMRERLAALTRKSRHAASRLEALHTGMYLLGTTYNFCWPHHELSQVRDEVTGKRRSGPARTPAMAAGLTDHVWSVWEVMSYKIAPPAWVEPKRRGRPRTRPMADPALLKRPRGRPRIRLLPDPTVPKRPRGRPRKVA
jgi:IS1 family transposase